jgi:HNH endonuclease
MSKVEHELARRLALYDEAMKRATSGLNKPSDLKELGIYGGASGVWVNKSETSKLDSAGIAVGLLHTGKQYDDDVDESGILYHYPTTNRPESRDQNEIKAIKNLGKFKLPVFVIRNVGSLRKVELAWLDDFDDSLRICVLTFHGFDPAVNPFRSESVVQEAQLFGHHRKTKSEVIKAERDPKFKFHIMQRFDGTCVATGTDVFQVLDAAHIIPVANRGTESVENGLLLSASAHRSFDANLWGINPDTLNLETQPGGPGLERLRIGIANLKHIESKLNREALEYRYKYLFLKKFTI